MSLSTFKPVPLNIVGQSYEHRSPSISKQRTINLIPQAELTGAAQSSLVSWYGSVPWSSGTGVGRGLYVFNGVLYKVSDQTLYSISSTGVQTSIGTITGSNRCVFADDGTNLIITTGSTGYQYSGSTLTSITDVDFPSSNSVAYLNQKMFYDGASGQFVVSTVGNPDDIPSNNFATAELSPDDTTRVYSFRERVYVFGEHTVEPWYDSGSGNPPVARVNGGVMNVGLGAVYSVANTDEYMYWLGDDKRVYRTSQYQAQNVTSTAVSEQLDELSALDDAVGYVVRLSGQSFYVLNCVAGGRTFVFSEDANAWFNLSSGQFEGNYIGTDYAECYGKRLIEYGGNVLYLDKDTYTDNGATRIYERTFGPITAKELGISGRVLMSYIDFHMQTGVGIISGQGSNPQIMVSASYDDQSWTNEDDVLLGRQGQGDLLARWDNTASFYHAHFRIRCSDPVFLAIHGASIGVKPGGY